jgi:thioredoxin-related protein/Tfp pilus assembly protein PilF
MLHHTKSPDWIFDYDLALMESNKTGKPIFMRFGYQGNFWTDYLDRTAFSDSTILEILKNFSCLKINNDINKALVNKYNVSGSTMLIADQNGKKLKEIPGYRFNESLSSFLEQGLVQYQRIMKGREITNEMKAIASNFNDAMVLARNRNVPIMLVIGDIRSQWSKKLQKETLPDDLVLSEMDGILSLYLEKDSKDPILKSIEIQGYPSILFFNPQGKLIYRTVGFKPASELADIMQLVKNSYQSRSDLASSVNWFYDLEEARSYALIEKKNILLYIIHNNCGDCNSMIQGVIQQPDIIKTMNDQFICMMINVFENPEVWSEYNISWTPSFLILDESGKEIFRTVGIKNRDEFKSWLDIKDQFQKVAVLGMQNYQLYIHELNKSELLYNYGYYRSSINILNELNKQIPEDPKVLLLLARSYFNQREFDQSIYYFKKAVDEGADIQKHVYTEMVYNFIQLNQVLPGIEYFRDKIINGKSNSQSVFYYSALISLFCAAEKTDSAVNICKDALRLYPSSSEILTSYGKLMYRRSDFGKADDLFYEAGRIDPTNAISLFYRGLIAEKRDLIKLRDKYFSQARLRNEDIGWQLHNEAYLAFFNLDYKSNRYLSETIYEGMVNTIKIDTIFDTYFYNMAQFLLTEKNRKEEALLFSKKAFQIDPTFIRNKFIYIWAILENGDTEKAREELNSTLANVHENEIKRDFGPVYTACKIYYESNQMDKAEHYYKLLKAQRNKFGYREYLMQEIDQMFGKASL